LLAIPVPRRRSLDALVDNERSCARFRAEFGACMHSLIGRAVATCIFGQRTPCRKLNQMQRSKQKASIPAECPVSLTLSASQPLAHAALAEKMSHRRRGGGARQYRLSL